MNQGSKNVCETCNDIGWVRISNCVKRCQCRILRALTVKLDKIPPNFRGVSLENYHKTAVNTCAPNELVSKKCIFPESFDVTKSWYICGKVGQGKTHLLWSQYRLFVENDFPVYGEVEPRLFKKLREQEYSDNVHFDTEKPDLHFFIDNLGVTKITEDRSMLLYQLINDLYDNRHGLTITSNYTLKQLEGSEMLGGNTVAITRRIQAMCCVAYF